MLTDIQKKIIRHVVEEMRPESEVTLEQINALNKIKVFKIYELYEYVHSILLESPRRYKFTKEKDLKKSIIYRTKEYY